MIRASSKMIPHTTMLTTSRMANQFMIAADLGRGEGDGLSQRTVGAEKHLRPKSAEAKDGVSLEKKTELETLSQRARIVRGTNMSVRIANGGSVTWLFREQRTCAIMRRVRVSSSATYA